MNIQSKVAVLLASTTLALGVAQAQSVTTYHNGNNRHGLYVVPGLTTAAAANMHRDTGFNGAISGNVYAQPLYWQPSGASVGRLIVATENNVVEALDANAGTPVWTAHLPAPAPLSALGCGNINPEGITGTPAIDPSSGTIYLDAVTDVAPAGVRHMIYAISASNGSVLTGYPIDVEAALAAKGMAFDPTIQGQRGGVLFQGGQVYVTYGGRAGDCGGYHGTVVQVNPRSHAIAGVWSTRATRGGIWAQGGISSDGISLFTTTGNTSGASSWGDGEAIIRLTSGLAHSTSTADYFTPGNWQSLDNSDTDLGGTEAFPILVPVKGAKPNADVIAFGKDGNAYLASRANLGGIGGQIAVTHVSNGEIITAPAVYNTPEAAMVAFRSDGNSNGCSGGNITMLNITSGSTPITQAWCSAFSGGGAPIITTTGQGQNPLVWAIGAEGDNQLHGFDAKTGASVFSGITGLYNLRHFETILAANSHFYVASSGLIYAFKFQ